MSQISEILKVLQEKRQILLQFEQATEEMLQCPMEELGDFVKERQKLVDRLKKLEERAELFWKETPGRECLTDVLQGEREASALPEELLEIYGEELQIRAIFSRLRECEPQAALRMRVEQKRVLEKIKSVNKGNSAKAARFFANAGGGGGTKFGNA